MIRHNVLCTLGGDQASGKNCQINEQRTQVLIKINTSTKSIGYTGGYIFPSLRAKSDFSIGLFMVKEINHQPSFGLVLNIMCHSV